MRQKNISLTEEQREAIRHRVREGSKSIERGDYREYRGGRGLKKLADEVKARGRRLLREVNELSVTQLGGESHLKQQAVKRTSEEIKKTAKTGQNKSK